MAGLWIWLVGLRPLTPTPTPTPTPAPPAASPSDSKGRQMLFQLVFCCCSLAQGRGLVCWFGGRTGRDFTHWFYRMVRGFECQREMSLLVLAVINIVYDMYVKVDTQAGICFEYDVQFSEIILVKRLIFFCFRTSDSVLSFTLINVNRKYPSEIAENKLKGRWNTIS